MTSIRQLSESSKTRPYSGRGGGTCVKAARVFQVLLEDEHDDTRHTFMFCFSKIEGIELILSQCHDTRKCCVHVIQNSIKLFIIIHSVLYHLFLFPHVAENIAMSQSNNI